MDPAHTTHSTDPDNLYCEVRRQPDGVTWRAYVLNRATNQVLRSCLHFHRVNCAAATCASRLAGKINRENGTRRSSGRVLKSEASPGQLRSRLAFAAGLRAGAVTRVNVNLLLKTHADCWGVEVLKATELDEGEPFGIVCEDCGVVARVKVTVDYDIGEDGGTR